MSVKREHCLTCERSLVCQTYTYDYGMLLFCDQHKRAFMCVSGEITRERAESMGVLWTEHHVFCKTHGVACACTVCEACPDWLEAGSVEVKDDKIEADFTIPVKYPLKRINLKIKLDD